MSLIQKYGKALVPAAIAVVTAAQAPVSDGKITVQEVITFLVAVNAAVGVYVAPNLTYKYAKTVVGVANAVLLALASVVIGGINAHDVTELLLAGLLAVTSVAAPAKSTPVIDGETVGEARDEPYPHTN
jgi:hypothetical protein